GGWGGKSFEMSLRKPSGDFDNWGASFGCTDDEEGYSAAVGLDSQLVFAGITNSIGCGFNDVYLIRLDTFLGDYFNQIYNHCDTPLSINTNILSAESNSTNCILYPNPTHDNITINCGFPFQNN